MNYTHYEVIIVGGSYAGLAAAMSLGRSLRKTLVIDNGNPCNRFTPHSHNFLTQDGSTPGEIAALARQQVEQYNTIQFCDDLAIEAQQSGTGFQIKTQSGQYFQANKLVFATGIKDIIPDINGFAECWGKSVIHCPYCHGYEYRDKKTAILVNEETVWHITPLIRNLTKEVTILTSGKVRFTPEEQARLSKSGVNVIESEIAGLEHVNGQLSQIIFKNNYKEGFDALYASLPFEQHCPIPVAMGCELTDKGHIKTDQFFKTTVDGIYACGDSVSPFRSVANAVSGGNITGTAINKELATEGF